VVTGTLTGGALEVGDELVLLPQDRRVRVRALQSLHADQPRVDPGHRTAVNLSGVTHEAVARGDVLVRPDQWHRTTTVDAALSVLGELDHEVTRRGAFVIYLGSGEHPVQLRVLRATSVRPGETAPVRLHLPVALPLLPGDRFVLRESGRQETVGGGEILDVDPVLPAAAARPDRSVDRVVAERGWVEADVLARLTGVERAPTVGRWVVDPEARRRAEADLRTAVAAAGPLGLDLAALDERERALIEQLEGVAAVEGRARAGDATDPLADHSYLRALAAAPFQPPAPDDVDRAELRALIQRGLVVEASGGGSRSWFAAAAVDQAARTVAALLRDRPEGVTVSVVRDALGTTRKHAVPLLEHLDATGVTRRRGDLRIAGPRLPDPPP
jgi:selenocysteine-specific elongation factor